MEKDIIGLDANVIIDMVESEKFRIEIQEQIRIDVPDILTTNIALGEARNVLVKKRGYKYEKATNSLQEILKEFNIKVISHNKECNELGNKWFDIIKEKMYIKKLKTFPNDCRIIANLFKQAKINVYITEDQEIEKVVNILKVSIKPRIIGEASHLTDFEIKRFFKEKHKASRKYHKHH